MEKEKQRIWELDALRGLCILCMIVIHGIYDLTDLGGVALHLPQWYFWIKDYGNVLFILISGICVTFSGRSFQRGITVFGAGLLVSYVTVFLDVVLGMSGVRIWFGVLHMLGISMMLYPLLRKLPAWALAVLGAAGVALGFYLRTVYVPWDIFFPLGLYSEGFFAGSDYFPMLPGFGWFLLGAFLGRTLYRQKKTLLPKVNDRCLPVRFLSACGRHSLWIYLLHQPVLMALATLISLL